jgi:hypothetical protein
MINIIYILEDKKDEESKSFLYFLSPISNMISFEESSSFLSSSSSQTQTRPKQGKVLVNLLSHTHITFEHAPNQLE